MVKSLKSHNLILLASDHNGFKLKNELKKYLIGKNFECMDMGNVEYDKNDDYVDFAVRAAKKIALAKLKGIFICGSGVGMCIAANKVKGIRAANVTSIIGAKLSRKDSDANVLCLGANMINATLVKKIVYVWLTTPFSNLIRYNRRIEKINKYEKNNTSHINE